MTTVSPATNGDDIRLTPAGRTVLEATARGRVRYLTGPQVVILRLDGNVLDASKPFMDLQRAGWAYIQPYDLDQPPPVEVMCRITPAGEDALMEAQQRARERKAGK
jgi:hypothetical protein